MASYHELHAIGVLLCVVCLVLFSCNRIHCLSVCIYVCVQQVFTILQVDVLFSCREEMKVYGPVKTEPATAQITLNNPNLNSNANTNTETETHSTTQPFTVKMNSLPIALPRVPAQPARLYPEMMAHAQHVWTFWHVTPPKQMNSTSQRLMRELQASKEQWQLFDVNHVHMSGWAWLQRLDDVTAEANARLGVNVSVKDAAPMNPDDQKRLMDHVNKFNKK